MAYTIEQIATALGARALGDGDIVITGAAEPADARTGRAGAGDEA